MVLNHLEVSVLSTKFWLSVIEENYWIVLISFYTRKMGNRLSLSHSDVTQNFQCYEYYKYYKCYVILVYFRVVWYHIIMMHIQKKKII